MPFVTPTIIKTGELYWCEPDPKDTVGSEMEKDRPWVIMSMSYLHRGNCVVGLPLTKNTSKACAHLIRIPSTELTMDGGVSPYDSVALTDQIRCLDKTRFRRKAGSISPKGLNAIKLGLERLFGM
jgi:mRNA-degrading endonuclease toxin of MazEF toxin-antitoxin module